MITDFPIHASVATADLERARTWYAEKLGLTPKMEHPGGLWYEFAPGTWLGVYQTQFAGTAKNTVAGWSVKRIEAVMADLRARGVVFEEYDMPQLKTVNGLATFGEMGKAAWFEDADGNIFELSERA